MTELKIRRKKKLRHLLDWYLKDCPFCDRDRYNVKEICLDEIISEI